MDSNTLAGNQEATDAQLDQATNEVQAQEDRSYSQKELDDALAKLKHSITRKYSKQFEELGDIDALKQLKQEAEQRRVEEAKKRGEFDNLMKELASKKDAEIAKRDSIIREYKVDMPILTAAAKYRSVNPEQVKSLLKSQVRMNDSGEVEVLDANGSVQYNDKGEMLAVDDFVRSWLDQNPHFVSPTPATAATQNSISPSGASAKIDISKLDMKNPEHRKLYAEYKKSKA
jgi:hypothetical protein